MAQLIVCPSCGAEISSEARQCPHCGHPIKSLENCNGDGAMNRKPDTHLAKAIIATILCCLPLGVVAIVYACKVDSLYAAGDYQGALSASRKASLWGNWSIGVSVFICILYFIFYVSFGGFAFLSSIGRTF